MPETKKETERLPIKLILPKQGIEHKVSGGGGPQQPFRTVDDEYRQRLLKQVSAIKDAITPQVKNTGVAPVRVKLFEKALAKSHRPKMLFSPNTCPIIGAGCLGELFVKATPEGLDKLSDHIKSTSVKSTKELSCIESIEPVTPEFRRKGADELEVLKRSPRRNDGFVTRVRLFNFGLHNDQSLIVSDFESVCREQKIIIDRAGYLGGSFTYAAECKSVNDVAALSRIVGVRSVSHMPTIRIVRPKMVNYKPIPKLSHRKDTHRDIPVVVVVDSGISSNNPALESWVVGRESSVAPEYNNPTHGTFVAGLIVWGSELNPTIQGLEQINCGVFDLQVIPNYDPEYGDTDSLTESELLQDLESALKQYSNNFKVWNLSIGLDEVCSLDEFSPLAEELDNLQEKYKVTFVISAGNYTGSPLLDYPRSEKQINLGRITSPADSVLGVTVGAVSHVNYNSNGPKLHHPTAFSRHGAGPNHIIKPDLVNYGGACSVDKSHVAGVRSICEDGTAEDLGTSFSTPLVSRTLAQIYHQITPTPSPELARALLTHHARDPRTNNRVPDGEENYFGFGLPASVPTSLECTPYTSTLVFEDVLRPGVYLEWDDFPYPKSLQKDGKYFGEIWMTIAFSPARGARWGSEYCETHIDAHFGVYRNQKSRKTGLVKQVFAGLVPPEHKNKGMLYEAYQVEKLRKWAPVRTYYGGLGKNGQKGERWRLMLRLLTRHGIEDEEAFRPQPFCLIVTISDPNQKAPVYDEMATIVRNRFQAQNLAVRATARIRS